ncbi:Serine/threonine-protein kinase PknD [Planctomycetes bacterium CA13]|uniref:Serine/threonine-protein kinase PknD n=1 Tax=Novipirellula herctigrandis TaxID=2527986 RepID=A0A5C5Z1K2_9BACT|nr:Serine/threonine-protein kinase PknD [Planctomycetes bacterium CA13]
MMLSLSCTDTDLPSPLPVGLERFSNRREMARGGNGVLYSGFDQVIGRTVAIKMLLPQFKSDYSFRRRLLREARVTAQLEHPGTVPVYEIGEDPEHGIYYVMKRISGECFFSVLRQIAKGDAEVVDVFPLRRRIEILIAVCQTLAFAHVRGVIHRDLKPSNIWIGNFGEVTLLDWGAAKVWGESRLDDANYLSSPVRGLGKAQSGSVAAGPVAAGPVADSRAAFELSPLTPAAQLLGTPTYMSPEQIGNRDLDERSDIFSAGVCLYEAMAIAEPFRGRDQEDTFDNICSRQPAPPSKRSPHRGIPDFADEIVDKALSKQASCRHQSMREFIADLDLLLQMVGGA